MHDLFLQARVHEASIVTKETSQQTKQQNLGKPLNVGDGVWLSNPQTPRGLSLKLTKHWTGPFIIKRQTSEVDYLINEEKERESFVVHHNRLELCTAPIEKATEVNCSPTNTKEQKD